MEEVEGKTVGGRKLSLPQDTKKIIIELDKINGKKLRRVSSTVEDGTIPSLTISAELKDLGWKKGDWVLVGVDQKKVVIEKAEEQ